MEDLRNSIEVDNHSALDVGHLKEGTRSFMEGRPKFEEGCPEVSIGEGPEELTLRTEEVGYKKSVHQCRSHCGGQVGTAFGGRLLACLLPGDLQRY